MNTRFFIGLGFLFLTALTPGLAFSEIFKWTDENGNIHFGDKPPTEYSTEKVEVKINSYSSPIITDGPDWKLDRKTVTMYSTTWCGVCKRAKKYFKANKIPYKEYDVEKSTKGQRDYKKLEGRGVPIILIGDKRMNGFSVARFQALHNS